MAGFSDTYSRALLRRTWVVVTILAALYGIQRLIRAEDWPWGYIVLCTIIVAQVMVAWELWRKAQAAEPDRRLYNARRWIDDLRDRGEELLEQIPEPKLREVAPVWPSDDIVAWLSDCEEALETMCGQRTRNSFTRHYKRFVAGIDWRTNVCRPVLSEGISFLGHQYEVLEASGKLNRDWNGERPNHGT